jgi:hypothetical protein
MRALSSEYIQVEMDSLRNLLAIGATGCLQCGFLIACDLRRCSVFAATPT